MFNSYQTVTLQYYVGLCINCEMCLMTCPHGVFEPGAEAVVLAHPEDCIECGACMVNCPVNAIHVNSGVGCAAAMIQSALTGKPESCGCGDSEGGESCSC